MKQTHHKRGAYHGSDGSISVDDFFDFFPSLCR